MGGTERTQRDGGERRRGRVAALVGVYLLWGVLLTWGVTWGVAAIVSPWHDGEQFSVLDMDRPRPQFLYVNFAFGATSVVCVREAHAKEVELLLARRGEVEIRELPGFAEGLVPGRRSSGGERAFAIHATGWPWRASSYTLSPEVQGNLDLALPSFGVRWTAGYRSDPKPTGALRVGGKALKSWQRLPGYEFWFPCIPLWKGLLADTLFYALLVWCLRRGFVRLRGWHRRHRLGSMWRCPCGYDLRGLVGKVCPECGQSVGKVG